MALQIKIDIEIDCNDKSCIGFTDTTGAYNASTNPGGYGGPNAPAIGNITSTEFRIAVGDDEFLSTYTSYIPNSAGTNHVCIPVISFLNTVTSAPLTLGANDTFTLSYTLTDNVETTYEVNDTIVFPCCGEQAPTDLGVNFSIQEDTGFTSWTFTDTTGTYNAETNTGGYGTPNPGYDDVASTLIRITLASGNIVNITSFVPTAQNQSFTITNQQLGYGSGEILPQVVSVEYYVYTDAVCQIGSATGDVLIHGVLSNCIVNRGKALLTNTGACCDGDEATNRVLNLIFRYEAMMVAAQQAISCVSKEVEDLYADCKQDCPDCT